MGLILVFLLFHSLVISAQERLVERLAIWDKMLKKELAKSLHNLSLAEQKDSVEKPSFHRFSVCNWYEK
jgi:hypothetical protein